VTIEKNKAVKYEEFASGWLEGRESRAGLLMLKFILTDLCLYRMIRQMLFTEFTMKKNNI